VTQKASHLLAIDPSLLLAAYAQGIFPMAEDAQKEEIFWLRPEKRGIILPEQFHVPRSLAKFARKQPFDICFDRDFIATLDACAATRCGREKTWINAPIRAAYCELAQRGFAHSVEAWQQGKLVGGLYGVKLGGAFFGESMFSHRTNASKLCLVALVQHLTAHGFKLLDTQFLTAHLAQFGAIEIPRTEYENRLKAALALQVSF